MKNRPSSLLRLSEWLDGPARESWQLELDYVPSRRRLLRVETRRAPEDSLV